MARPKAAPVTPAPARTKPMLAVVSTALSVSAVLVNDQLVALQGPDLEGRPSRVARASAMVSCASAVGWQ